MIADVNRRHARVTGVADDGRAYAADDTVLLDWVQATASYGFIEAYHRFARRLSDEERDRAWAEGAAAARLYGATGAPMSQADWGRQLELIQPLLTPSPVVFEFLDIMRNADAFPRLARPIQRMLVRAAVDLTPSDIRARLGLTPEHGLRAGEAGLIRTMALAAERVPLKSAPPAQASIRMGLPPDWPYRRA